jgi:hypothetical protein
MATTATNGANGRIRDLASFDQRTGDPRQVAGIYFYALLDPLIELAYWIAKDFFARPHLYTDVGDPKVVEGLAQLGARYGADEHVPSLDQRRGIYGPLFGPPADQAEGQSSFERLQDELAKAATAFAERAVDTGLAMLRERIRANVTLLKEYLDGLRGDSVNWSREQALAAVTEGLAYRILRNRGVATVFGVAAPAATWPYAPDTNGDKLVEAVSQQAAWVRSAADKLTRQRFSNLQRAAVTGAEAIAAVLDFTGSEPDAELDALTTRLYAWASAVADAREPSIGPPPPAATAALPAAGRYS